MNTGPGEFDLDDLLKWICVGLSLIAIIVVQFRAFGFGRKSRNPRNIASFFTPRQLLSKRQRNILSIVTMAPLTFVFVVVSGRSRTFLEMAVGVFHGAVGSDSRWKDVVTVEMVSLVPEPLHPFIILIVFVGIFRNTSEFVYRRVERMVLYGSGLLPGINGAARQSATVLLEAGGSYEDVIDLLEAGRQNRVPLPVELVDAVPEVQLSFQLLYLAEPDIPAFGVRRALQRLAEDKCGDVLAEHHRTTLGFPTAQDVGDAVQDPTGEEARQMSERFEMAAVPETRDFAPLVLWEPRGRDARADWGYIISGVVVYAVVCGLYVAVVPAASDPFEAMGIIWPEPPYRWDLVWDIGVFTVAAILPTLLGIAFVARRSVAVRETPARRNCIVLLSVFSFSVAMYFVNMMRVMSEYYLGDRISVSSLGPHMLQFPEWVYIVCHALVPCLAVLVLTIGDPPRLRAGPREIVSGGKAVAAIAVISASHALAYLAFELAADYAIHYYVHQALLAAVLSASALLMFRGYWKPRRMVGQVRSSS